MLPYTKPATVFVMTVQILAALVGFSIGSRTNAAGGLFCAMTSLSAAYLFLNHIGPDGWGGFGRVAALWLGLLVLMPAALIDAALSPGWFGQNIDGALMAATFWLLVAFTLIAESHRLTAGPAIRFSLWFNGLGAMAGIIIAILPASLQGLVFAVAFVASGWVAAVVRAMVEPVPMALIAIDPEPVSPESEAEPALEKEQENEAEEPPVIVVYPDEEDDEPDERPRVPLPVQTAPGSDLLLRWLIGVILDYTLIFGGLAALLLMTRDPSRSFNDGLMLCLYWYGGYLVYHPLLEGFTGATLGQRLMGLRLVDPGTSRPPDWGVVVRRHIARISAIWGPLGALVYWLKEFDEGPEGRERAAQGCGNWTSDGQRVRDYLIIDLWPPRQDDESRIDAA